MAFKTFFRKFIRSGKEAEPEESAPIVIPKPPEEEAPLSPMPGGPGPGAVPGGSVDHALDMIHAIHEVLGEHTPVEAMAQIPCRALLSKLPEPLRGMAWRAEAFPEIMLEIPRDELLGQIRKGRISYPLSNFLQVLPAGWVVDADPETKVDLDLAQVIHAVPPDWLRLSSKVSDTMVAAARMKQFFKPLAKAETVLPPPPAEPKPTAAVPPETAASPVSPPTPPEAATPISAPIPVPPAVIQPVSEPAVPTVPEPKAPPPPAALPVQPVEPKPITPPVKAVAMPPEPILPPVRAAVVPPPEPVITPVPKATPAPVVAPQPKPLPPAEAPKAVPHPLPTPAPMAATPPPSEPPAPVGAWDGIEVGVDAGPNCIDLNRANVNELQRLPGVGAAFAETILKYREAHGPFAGIFDLALVPGIGKKHFHWITGLSLAAREDRHDLLNDALGFPRPARPSLSKIAEAARQSLRLAGCIISNLDGMPLACNQLLTPEEANQYAALVPHLFRRTERYLRPLVRDNVNCVALPLAAPRLLLFHAGEVYVILVLDNDNVMDPMLSKAATLARELEWLLGFRAVVRKA